VLFTGPVYITVLGPSAEDIAAIVAAQLTAALTPLETTMTDASTFLTDLGPKIDTLTTGMADIAADVQVLLDKAAAAGVFTSEEQALADGVTAKMDALKAAVSSLNDEVGDQDGSDNPPPAEG
jgi:outer membrane murein-binding lipoprotein Lpp